MAAVVMLLLEMNERKNPSAPERIFKRFGKRLYENPRGSGGKLLYGVTDPKKAKRKAERRGKGIARDFANAGKGIASAGNDLYHGRIADAYHDVTHGADGLARRMGMPQRAGRSRL